MWPASFFINAAYSTGFAGLLLILAGLLKGRSKGRRRCPKCWYDIADGVNQCSECGFKAKRERQWLKARRKKRLIVIGVLVSIGAAWLGVTPQVREHGWWSIVPDVVLIAGLGRLERGGLGDDLVEELAKRVDHAHWAGRWRQRWLESRCLALLRHEDLEVAQMAIDIAIIAPHPDDAWVGRALDQIVGLPASDGGALLSRLRRLPSEDARATHAHLDQLLALAWHEDAEVASNAISIIRRAEVALGRWDSTDALLELYEQRPDAREAIVYALVEVAPPRTDVFELVANADLTTGSGFAREPISEWGPGEFLAWNTLVMNRGVTDDASARAAWAADQVRSLSNEELIAMIDEGRASMLAPALNNANADLLEWFRNQIARDPPNPDVVYAAAWLDPHTADMLPALRIAAGRGSDEALDVLAMISPDGDPAILGPARATCTRDDLARFSTVHTWFDGYGLEFGWYLYQNYGIPTDDAEPDNSLLEAVTALQHRQDKKPLDDYIASVVAHPWRGVRYPINYREDNQHHWGPTLTDLAAWLGPDAHVLRPFVEVFVNHHTTPNQRDYAEQLSRYIDELVGDAPDAPPTP